MIMTGGLMRISNSHLIVVGLVMRIERHKPIKTQGINSVQCGGVVNIDRQCSAIFIEY